MFIEKVKLKNFRNYKEIELSLRPHLNVLKGNNAQGKTNFLESIYLSSIGRSPKTTKEKELILWGERQAKIEIVLQKKYHKQTTEIFLSDNLNKSIKIQGLSIRKIGDLIGEMPVVYFSPEEIGLIKDGPSDRRRFMDIDISQLNRNYFYLLCRYEKILSERNKLLKQTRVFESLHQTIDLWDRQLADTASKIIFFRLDFLERLKTPAQNVHKRITSGQEDLDLSYQGIQTKNIEIIKEKLLKEYKNSLKKDFEYGYTSIGPHRDDIKITINNTDIRSYGSQGQQRLATLSLKVAELSLFEEMTQEKPILLLDDVLSELDFKRCKNFLNEIKEYQTILTTTKFSREIDEKSTVFVVSNGTIKEKVTKRRKVETKTPAGKPEKVKKQKEKTRLKK